jgi:hypothetical protein
MLYHCHGYDYTKLDSVTIYIYNTTVLINGWWVDVKGYVGVKGLIVD